MAIPDLSTSGMLRAFNERRVVELIAAEGPISRAQIARVSGLSKPTVSLALVRLEEHRLVREVGRTSGGRGATATLYALEPTAGYALAFDVGKRWLRAALVDVAGAEVARETERTRLRPEDALVSQLCALTERLVAAAAVDRAAVVAATLATPGIVPGSGADHVELAPSVPALQRSGVLDRLREQLQVQLRVENDVNAAAMAELTYGVGRDEKDFAYVSLGTGVGLALVLDGVLRRGASAAAGEIGYLPAPTSAGGHGRATTIETGASAAALIRAAREEGSTARTAEGVVTGARSGDPAAGRALDRVAAVLTVGVAAACAVADPAVVVLGGGIGLGAADLLIPRIERELHTLLPMRPRVVASRLSGDAVLQGAVATTLLAARRIVFARTSRPDEAPRSSRPPLDNPRLGIPGTVQPVALLEDQ
jgi:predicted NBD/HSP70 family sugar kinase